MSQKREDKYEGVIMNEKMQEYQREKKLEEIMEKMKKIDVMK